MTGLDQKGGEDASPDRGVPAGGTRSDCGEGPDVGAALRGAVRGECPRCGATTLFEGGLPAGWVRFAAKCGSCGLDYARFNVGDGPAAFLTLIIGTIITGLAIWLDLAVNPPFWVHVILWVPLTAIMVMGGLRVAKGLLLIVEYHRDAREAGGRDPDDR